MSEPVSALGGATYAGFATVADTGPRGMISIRADFSDKALVTALKPLGLTLPASLGSTEAKGRVLAWMSPDELLLLCPYDEAAALAAQIDAALGGTHALVANVSDARVVFELVGDKAHEVLRKLTPANLDDMSPGSFRRTRLAQVAGAIHMRAPDRYEVLVFRSQAQYVFDLLSNAAQPGSELWPEGTAG